MKKMIQIVSAAMFLSLLCLSANAQSVPSLKAKINSLNKKNISLKKEVEGIKRCLEHRNYEQYQIANCIERIGVPDKSMSLHQDPRFPLRLPDSNLPNLLHQDPRFPLRLPDSNLSHRLHH